MSRVECGPYTTTTVFVLCICASIMTSEDQLKLLSDSTSMSDPLLSSPPPVNSQLQTHDCDSVKSLSATEHHRKMPVFQSEEDRFLFERYLEVDIAPLVSGMYVTQSAKQNVRCAALTLFTCTTCNKVFTSQSRCQLHCLIHTRATPYRCPWCHYSTNVRGYFCRSSLFLRLTK